MHRELILSGCSACLSGCLDALLCRCVGAEATETSPTHQQPPLASADPEMRTSLASALFGTAATAQATSEGAAHEGEDAHEGVLAPLIARAVVQSDEAGPRPTAADVEDGGGGAEGYVYGALTAGGWRRTCVCEPTAGGWRSRLAEVVGSAAFSMCALGLVLVNVVVMCMPYAGMSSQYSHDLEAIWSAITWLFIAEMGLKITALGCRCASKCPVQARACTPPRGKRAGTRHAAWPRADLTHTWTCARCTSHTVHVHDAPHALLACAAPHVLPQRLLVGRLEHA